MFVLLLVMAAPAAADVTLPFGGSDFGWLALGVAATPYHVWTAGDYWAQEFDATGLNCVGSLSLDLFIDDNILDTGAQVDMNVLLNGTAVGSFTLLPGVTGLQNFTFNPIGPISGPDFYVKMLETNTVPGGFGSVSINPAQSSITLGSCEAAVPEFPAPLLAASGLGGLAGLLRRRRK